MKVFLLIDTTVFAGTERHMLHLASGLRALGVDAGIACPAWGALGKRAQEANVPVFGIDSAGARTFGGIWRLVRALRAGQVDVIHAHNGRTALLSAIAIALARRGALVTTQHFLFPARTNRRGALAALANALHGWVERGTAQIIAISEAVRDAAIARGGEPQKLTVVPNGIADPLEDPAIAPRATVRAALGVAEDVPLVIAASRLEKEKGVGVLVRAMSQVAKQIPAARCFVAGEGKELAALENLIRELNVGQTVTLLGFRNDVLSLVAAADVFVLPSPAEPFGLSLIEAMALHVPAIASRAGGPVEILAGDHAGLLVQPDSAEEFAGAIVRVLQDPALAGALREGGRAKFVGHYTASRMAAQTKEVYAKAVGDVQPSPVAATTSALLSKN